MRWQSSRLTRATGTRNFMATWAESCALAHLLLDGLRQKIDQGQAPRHPTEAAIKAARQLLLSIAVALLQLRQQPAFFQRRLVFGEAQRAVQDQGLDFAHRPDHRFHRVPAQLLERRQALVAINDQVPVRLAFDRHHHDRRLLPHFRQRGQQLPLPSGSGEPANAPSVGPVGETPSAFARSLTTARVSLDEAVSGLVCPAGEVCPQLPWNQGDKLGTGLAWPVPGVLP